jgi:hypothetical protein
MCFTSKRMINLFFDEIIKYSDNVIYKQRSFLREEVAGIGLLSGTKNKTLIINELR